MTTQRGDGGILRRLLDESRLVRFLEQQVYPPEDLLADLCQGIWAELYSTSHSLDPYRAALQRIHLELMAERLHHSPVIRGYARGELSTLDGDIRGALTNTQLDRPTRLYLEDAHHQITGALSPMSPPPAPQAVPGTAVIPAARQPWFLRSPGMVIRE